MKKLHWIVLLTAMLFTTAGAASAIELKVKGQWDFAFGWASNVGWGDSIQHERGVGDADNFIARQRVRTQVNFIASEQLQGVLMFEIGDINWGRNENGTVGRGSGGALDADGVNVETKRAYLDWMIPETDVTVRMGIQGMKLPSGPLGSPVLDTDVAGITVSSPITDMISVTGFWLRPFDRNESDGDAGRYDEMDLFGLVVPVAGEGWAVTPWAMYGFLGASSGYYNYVYGPQNSRYLAPATDYQAHDSIWWAGLSFELSMFDPLTFTFDAIYGDSHRNNMNGAFSNFKPGFFGPDATQPLTSHDGFGSQGWFLAATLDYKLDWGTPGIFGWYSSGDSANADDTGTLGRLPIVSVEENGFTATSFGAKGSPGITTDAMLMGSGVGTWGIGLQIAEMSFIPDLKHTLRVAYYRGTNDHELVEKGGIYFSTNACDDMYLTDRDYAWEVNFDHEYKIYENLTARLELGYIHLKLDEDVWNSDANSDMGFFHIDRTNPNGDSSNDAWKVQVAMQYAF